MTGSQLACGMAAGFVLAACFCAAPARAQDPVLALEAKKKTAKDLKCKGCVGKKDLGKKSVTAKSIAGNAILSKHIEDKAMKSAHIADKAITPDKLASAAKPTGADATVGDVLDTWPLGLDPVDVVSTTITAPSAGYFVASATWTFLGSVAKEFGLCALSDTASTTDAALSVTYFPSNENAADAASLSRVIQVPSGDTTIHLYCASQNESSLAGHVVIQWPSITAFFVPNKH